MCARGFTFEYSATFEQAVSGTAHEDDYAKTILFDYSYRWFYEDGFGKDYQILNLPSSHQTVENSYLIACLLKFYQQLRIYEERKDSFTAFNLEKPLWVFVGSTVSKAKGTGDEKAVAADVARIVQFLASFLADSKDSARWIEKIVLGNGQQTGLLDADGNDIFGGSFNYLAEASSGQSFDDLYRDILGRVFHCPAGGLLSLSRVKGDAGEVVLKVGNSDEPFGLINVGDAKGLCDHIEENKDELLPAGDLSACAFGKHLFQPLFHVRKGGKITILPVALSESEYQFVTDLAEFARSGRLRMVTLDKDFRNFEPHGLDLLLLSK